MGPTRVGEERGETDVETDWAHWTGTRRPYTGEDIDLQPQRKGPFGIVKVVLFLRWLPTTVDVKGGTSPKGRR